MCPKLKTNNVLGLIWKSLKIDFKYKNIQKRKNYVNPNGPKLVNYDMPQVFMLNQIDILV